MTKEYRKITIHKSGRVDPDNTTLVCEAPHCDKEVLMGQSYSFIVVFATTGPHPIPAFQCEEEQHFACCPQHARLAAIACIDQHLLPKHQEKLDELSGGKTTVTEAPTKLLP